MELYYKKRHLSTGERSKPDTDFKYFKYIQDRRKSQEKQSAKEKSMQMFAFFSSHSIYLQKIEHQKLIKNQKYDKVHDRFRAYNKANMFIANIEKAREQTRKSTVEKNIQIKKVKTQQKMWTKKVDLDKYLERSYSHKEVFGQLLSSGVLSQKNTDKKASFNGQIEDFAQNYSQQEQQVFNVLGPTSKRHYLYKNGSFRKCAGLALSSNKNKSARIEYYRKQTAHL